MKYLILFYLLLCTIIYSVGCINDPVTINDPGQAPIQPYTDTSKKDTVYTVVHVNPAGFDIDTKNLEPGPILNFAKTLIGVPYKYGSTDPTQGFDCSGFISYVFNHFDITVPRSSIDFTEVGSEVRVSNAAPGDLILFTGTDSTERFVGHMGIVVENTDSLRFIHSTSGKKYGVTITALNEYYKKRFVKITRIFQQQG